MNLLIKIISFLWLIRTAKAVFFWIYLWQLKEYHIGRFLDHFRTYKGKKIFFNFLFLAKLFVITLIFIKFSAAIYLLLLIYAVESFLFIIGRFKQPVWRFKTMLLTSFSLLFTILVYSQFLKNLRIDYFVFALLIFDILTPLIVSAIVLIFQPFFVLARNNILSKAKNKISKFKNLTVVGITGSYGKTSTKEFLATILSSKFRVLATKEHKNSEMGIAETILKGLNKNHQIFVVEMGSYNKGGIKLLCDIVKPKIGIVTGINEQHLATFGSMENLLSAEGGRELLENLQENGLLVVNGDNKYCLNLYKKAQNYRTIHSSVYTINKDKVDSDIWAKEITVNKDSLDFMGMTRDGEAAYFNVKVLGKQNIQNLLGAILVAGELGMNLEEISLAVKNIKPEQAGIVLKKGIYGINIIDSSYSSNPDGAIADLDYLSVFENKKVVVMPCLIELGKKSAEVHRQIGEKIAEICDMAIITTKDKFEEIKNSAVNHGIAEDRIIFNENPVKILHLITTFCKQSDTVLLEGRVPSELIKLLLK